MRTFCAWEFRFLAGSHSRERLHFSIMRQGRVILCNLQLCPGRLPGSGGGLRVAWSGFEDPRSQWRDLRHAHSLLLRPGPPALDRLPCYRTNQLGCFGRRSALVFVVISVFIATGVRTRLTATWILVALIAALLLTALIPDRVGEQVHNLDGHVRIVTLDFQFARSRTFFGGNVSNHQVHARVGLECCGERIVDELPMTPLAPESDTGYVQTAFGGIGAKWWR